MKCREGIYEGPIDVTRKQLFAPDDILPED